ncbi:MAG TPA: copper homeostasis periplasmic binding protein CopC [Caulobacteraceae bacterium]|jgi:methionine-rich copper-binding protein CopC|nr:copper homeostasis periplasmic binding protein CopC [Caulobacteraceae bacterium]
MNALSKFAALALLAAPLALIGSGAEAHAKLVKADPAANAAVGAPQVIHLEFSEKLEPKFSGAQLMKADGTNIDVVAKANGKAVDATPKTRLAPGQYMVMWHAVTADDGHKTNGDYNFTVK